MEGDLIALFEFEESEHGVMLTSEKHYRLVSSDGVEASDLETYRTRSLQ